MAHGANFQLSQKFEAFATIANYTYTYTQMKQLSQMSVYYLTGDS